MFNSRGIFFFPSRLYVLDEYAVGMIIITI